MHIYEIRITRQRFQGPDIFRSAHISDFAAVRRAHLLAGAGAAIEVWRGMECIFAGAAQVSADASIQTELQS
jgi:hypothetical protein